MSPSSEGGRSRSRSPRRACCAAARRPWAQWLLAVACAILGGCATFEPLSPELARRLDGQAAEPSAVRRQALIEVEGARFAGLFEAVLISDYDRSSARLQLLPEVGAKVLDLAVGPGRIAGYVPPAGISLAHAWPEDGPLPRHLLAFLAASISEVVTPITSSRVLGARAVEGGTQLRLRPVVPGVEVRALVDAQGRLLSREYRLRRVTWRERVLLEARVFEARGMRWILTERPPVTIDAPPASLFELEVPPDEGPRSRAPHP